MSSILDSLRKSDQNRKKSDTGGSGTFSFSQNSDRNLKLKLIVWIILILLLLATLFWSWQQGMFTSLFSDDTNNTVVEIKDQQQTPQNTVSLPPPDQQAVKESVKQQQADVLSSNSNDNIPQADIDKNTEQITLIEAEPKTEDSVESKEAKQAQAPTIKPESDITVSKADEEKQQGDTVSKQDHLYIYQLPFAIRRNIPPIKVNIHVYDPEPKNRLAVINGVRFSIGDVIEEILTVKDITQEGIVFEFQEHTFLLPK